MAGARTSKGKGQRFQKEVAEAIATHFGWTIEALKPSSAGKGLYVAESADPDLRVRQMGASGNDVAPLSARAKRLFSFAIEAKIRAELPSLFCLAEWTGFDVWFLQASLTSDDPHVLIFRQNRSKPWVAFCTNAAVMDPLIALHPPHVVVRLQSAQNAVLLPLASWLQHLEHLRPYIHRYARSQYHSTACTHEDHHLCAKPELCVCVCHVQPRQESQHAAHADVRDVHHEDPRRDSADQGSRRAESPC